MFHVRKNNDELFCLILWMFFFFFQACFHNGEHLSSGDQWQKVSGDECVTCTCRKDGTANCTRMPGSCQSGRKPIKGFYMTSQQPYWRTSFLEICPLWAGIEFSFDPYNFFCKIILLWWMKTICQKTKMNLKRNHTIPKQQQGRKTIFTAPRKSQI